MIPTNKQAAMAAKRAAKIILLENSAMTVEAVAPLILSEFLPLLDAQAKRPTWPKDMDEATLQISELTNMLQEQAEAHAKAETDRQEREAWQLDNATIVAACNCLTKTPDIQYHKPGCKYRLICERNNALDELAALRSAPVQHWAVGKALRRAFVETLSPLYLRLPLEKPFGTGKQSRDHLIWMSKELLDNIDVFPIDKTSRWIGFIQGVMAANGLLDVDAERERTRPFFKKAYEIEAVTAPVQPAQESTLGGDDNGPAGTTLQRGHDTPVIPSEPASRAAPAQELREVIKKAAAEYYTATWGKAVGALYANEDGESALSEIVLRHVAPHVEAARRDSELVDFLASYWQSQRKLPQQVMNGYFIDNPTGSFRDAVHAERVAAAAHKGKDA